jgi:hypothetical protein
MAACWGKLENKIQCCRVTLVSESTGLVVLKQQNVAFQLSTSVTCCVERVALVATPLGILLGLQ